MELVPIPRSAESALPRLQVSCNCQRGRSGSVVNRNAVTARSSAIGNFLKVITARYLSASAPMAS